MTSESMREPILLIREAELLSGSNDFVRTFYLSKENLERRSHDLEVDAETEAKLLAKGDPFIDITLAQYCIFSETIAELFRKSMAKNNVPLKLACLSNRSIASYGGDWPSALFAGDEEALFNWLPSISSGEVRVLFRNNTISRKFLEFLFGTIVRGGHWSELTENLQLQIVRALSENEILGVEYKYEGVDADGMAATFHGLLLDSIWSLAEKAPATGEWALALEKLLSKAVDPRPWWKDCSEIAQRWVPLERTDEIFRKSKEFGGHEYLRVLLYQNVFRNPSKEAQSSKPHFDNEDIAYRASAYRSLNGLSVVDIEAAYAKDESIAIEWLLNNYSLFRSADTREALLNICLDADRRRNSDYSLRFRWAFEDCVAKSPGWFTADGALADPRVAAIFESIELATDKVNAQVRGAFGKVVEELGQRVHEVERAIENIPWQSLHEIQSTLSRIKTDLGGLISASGDIKVELNKRRSGWFSFFR